MRRRGIWKISLFCLLKRVAHYLGFEMGLYDRRIWWHCYPFKRVWGDFAAFFKGSYGQHSDRLFPGETATYPSVSIIKSSGQPVTLWEFFGLRDRWFEVGLVPWLNWWLQLGNCVGLKEIYRRGQIYSLPFVRYHEK